MPKREPLIIEGVKYELESTLGGGGSGEVWRSRRMSDGAVFAVKQITKDPEAGSPRNQRFEQEIEFGQSADHPNVLKIHSRSEDANFFYYVMDIYPSTLRDVIMNESDAEVLLSYALQLCGALAYVHGAGIVHRDIKPENVLVDPDTRQLVLADFGIAHFKDSVLTKRGDLLVNRNYLAPEQMVRNNAHAIGKPADIYSLGLVITELFTKQNARGRLHALVRDSYPFLADLDPIVGQMLLQDEAQRLPVETVHGLIRIAWQRFESAIEETRDELRPNDQPGGVSRDEVERVLGRAARDVLSAKRIFERVPDQELGRYNLNYHCEISYRVSQELFNTCVQAVVFAQCMAKFVYEGGGSWDKRDDAAVSSASKPELLRELHLILNDFPLPMDSLWSGMSRQTSHLFRFIKDYHCRELLTSIRESVYEQGNGSLRDNLIGAPILWIARSVREYLDTEYLKLDRAILEEIGLEHQLSVIWSETLPINPTREATGAELLSEPFNTDGVANTIETLKMRWDVSVGELPEGNFSVMFRSRDEYQRFRDEGLALAVPDSVFEADILNLLRPEAEFDDLVALTWGRDFDVAITLRKVLGISNA